MATQKGTIDFILQKLGNDKRFSTRAMFGEYALYVDGKVVALVCNDQLYVKILPASDPLEEICEQDSPYPGARLHYVVEESQLSNIENLAEILFAVATEVPDKKKKVKGKK
jgi:TfoX/Sxy family transcriptional regulator of competence genes